MVEEFLHYGITEGGEPHSMLQRLAGVTVVEAVAGSTGFSISTIHPGSRLPS